MIRESKKTKMFNKLFNPLLNTLIPYENIKHFFLYNPILMYMSKANLRFVYVKLRSSFESVESRNEPKFCIKPSIFISTNIRFQLYCMSYMKTVVSDVMKFSNRTSKYKIIVSWMNFQKTLVHYPKLFIVLLILDYLI